MQVLPQDLTRTGRREVGALTGIRGLAACYVVAYHLHMNDGRLYLPSTLLHHGYLAVDLFFVLSGFVMTLSYNHLFASGTTARAYAAFLIRRLARVYPLYAVMLTVTAAMLLAPSLRHHVPLSRDFAIVFLTNVLMIQSWGINFSLNGPSWSISTELAAYLLFPALLGVLVRGRLPVWMSAIACLVVVELVAIHPTPNPTALPKGGPLDVYWPRSVWPVVRCLSEFSLGILAFRVAERNMPAFGNAVLVWIVAVAAVGLLFVPGSDVAFVCLIPLLLIGIMRPRHPVSRFLASPVPMTLGHWSYAIYLCHILLFGISYRSEALAARVMPIAVARVGSEIAFWTVLLCVASLSYRYVETPGRRVVRQFELWLFPREHGAIRVSELVGVQVGRDS